MRPLVLRNAMVFDGVSAELQGPSDIVVADGLIQEMGTTRRTPPDGAQSLDCNGRVVMPGLIDAHFHAYGASFSVYELDRMPKTLISQYAASHLEGALQRGFTAVRDAAGGDVGLALAIQRGLIRGPRFFYSGLAISQTGGHGDMRPGQTVELCACSSYSGSLTTVADGDDEVRKAVREELRKGATQIKILASGGVMSPSDPIWMVQYTESEMRAAVEEAATRRTYVMAHCHTSAAARRCVAAGVRSIEHGTVLDFETAKIIAAANAFVVPTMSVVNVYLRHGDELPLPPGGIEKFREIGACMAASVDACAKAGVQLGLGTDLFGIEFHAQQGEELALRGEIQRPIDVLRSATSINAKLLQQEGQLGCVKIGAYADLLVVNGDPLKDLGLFRDAARNLPVIVRGGELVKNLL